MHFTQKVAFDLENQFLLKIHLIFYVKRFLIIDWFNKSIEMCEKRGVTTVREGNEEGERIALRGKKLEKSREREIEKEICTIWYVRRTAVTTAGLPRTHRRTH